MTSPSRAAAPATASGGRSRDSPRRTRARSRVMVGRSTQGVMVRLPARRASEKDGRRGGGLSPVVEGDKFVGEVGVGLFDPADRRDNVLVGHILRPVVIP